MILSFFFALFLALDLVRQSDPATMSVPLFFLSWSVLLVLHELGHAGMARLAGWKVEKISIGMGPVLRQFRVANCCIEFRLFPISGYVVPRPGNLVCPRFKNCLIFAAGPAIELLLGGLVVFGLGWETLLGRSRELGIIAAQCFCIAALWGAVFNLIPFPHRGENGLSWSDGLGMLRCWHLPDSWFEDLMKRGDQGQEAGCPFADRR